jgi:hypothetical protein
VLWASPESAHSALALYRKAMEKKSTELKWSRQSGDRAEGSNQYGGFRIVQEGSRLEAVEGLP